jgi:hypothetical protein
MNQPYHLSETSGLKVYYLFDRYPLDVGSRMLAASKRCPENVNVSDVVSIHWSVPRWKQRLAMSDECKIYDPVKMEYSIDSMAWRDKWLKHSMVSWDLKDRDGQLIPLTHENIDELPADFIDQAISGYESVSEEDDRSVGKAWRRSAAF